MRLALVLALALAGCREKSVTPIRVAAASDLTDVFTELARRYEGETHQKVELTFGSSGLLARQLAQGAPFDVFAAASQGFVDDVVKAGACDGASATRYARGRLVLWPPGATTTLEALAQGKQRVAMANPEHAPYGRAAKEALVKAGVWERVEPRVVYSENVRQALQFADTGNVEVAFVAWSNVVSRDAGALTLVDASLHAPIEQVLVRCKHGKRAADAAAFTSFLERPESQALLMRSGFER